MSNHAEQNPYAPPEARVSDYEEASGTIEPASRGIRFGAAMIDLAVFLVIYAPLLIATGFDVDAIASSGALTELAGIATMLLVLAWIAITIVLVYRNGQTIGKKLVGIKVVRSNGMRASLSRIFWLRNFVNGIPGAIPLLGYVYILVDHLLIFGARRQCIHDLIADTIVVRA